MQEGFPISLAIIVATAIFSVLHATSVIVFGVLLAAALGG